MMREREGGRVPGIRAGFTLTGTRLRSEPVNLPHAPHTHVSGTDARSGRCVKCSQSCAEEEKQKSEEVKRGGEAR